MRNRGDTGRLDALSYNETRSGRYQDWYQIRPRSTAPFDRRYRISGTGAPAPLGGVCASVPSIDSCRIAGYLVQPGAFRWLRTVRRFRLCLDLDVAVGHEWTGWTRHARASRRRWPADAAAPPSTIGLVLKTSAVV